MKSNAYAIILASGFGKRLGKGLYPKHLIKINNIPLIIWSISQVLKTKYFKKIIVCTHKKYLKETKKIIKKYYNKRQEIFITQGARERMESFFNGSNYLKKILHNLNTNDVIGLFDANRPFAPKNQLQALITIAKKNKLSCPARTIVNGVAKINKNKIIEVPLKEKFVNMITPEFVRYDLLNKFNNNLKKKEKSLVEYGFLENIFAEYVDFNELNSKLTYLEDISYFEFLINSYKIKYK